MKLLSEQIDSEVEYLIERDVNGNKSHFIHGVFMMGAPHVNRNKRTYPVPTLAREATRYTNERIIPECAWGEMSHPSGPNINLDRACILVRELTQEGTDWYGKAEICPTPMGDTLKGLMQIGKVGVSSRALGSLTEKNGVFHRGRGLASIGD